MARKKTNQETRETRGIRETTQTTHAADADASTTAPIHAIAQSWTAQFPPDRPLVVDTEADYIKSGEVYAALDSALKEMEQKRMAIARPIQAGLTKLKAEVDEAKQPLERLKEAIQQARRTYRVKAEQEAAQLAAAQAAQRDAEVQQVAVQTGRPVEEVANILPPAPPPPPPPPSVPLSTGGTLGTTRIPKWRLTGQPPWEWRGKCLYKLDEAVLTELRRAAGEDLSAAPPGVEYYYETVDVHRSR